MQPRAHPALPAGRLQGKLPRQFMEGGIHRRARAPAEDAREGQGIHHLDGAEQGAIGVHDNQAHAASANGLDTVGHVAGNEQQIAGVNIFRRGVFAHPGRPAPGADADEQRIGKPPAVAPPAGGANPFGRGYGFDCHSIQVFAQKLRDGGRHGRVSIEGGGLDCPGPGRRRIVFHGRVHGDCSLCFDVSNSAINPASCPLQRFRRRRILSALTGGLYASALRKIDYPQSVC